MFRRMESRSSRVQNPDGTISICEDILFVVRNSLNIVSPGKIVWWEISLHPLGHVLDYYFSGHVFCTVALHNVVTPVQSYGHVVVGVHFPGRPVGRPSMVRQSRSSAVFFFVPMVAAADPPSQSQARIVILLT